MTASITVVALGLSAVACGDDPESATGAAGDSVSVGLIVPLSGQFASIGDAFQNSVELYLEQHDNQLGGREVELVTVDEGAGADEALPGARRLIQEDQVDVVTGVVSSATAAAVFPNFEQAQIPVVFSQGYPYEEPEPEASPYLWSTGSTVVPFAASMGAHLAEEVPGSDGVYFIAADYVQGHTILDATRQAFEDAGGTVAGEAFAPLGEALDYQPYLSDIQQSGAAAVWSFFSGSDAVQYVQQYDSFGLAGELPHYSTSSLISGRNLAEEGDSALGIVTNTQYDPSLENPANEAFVEAYEAEFGALPDGFAEQQYDSMAILDQALAEVDGELSSEAIIEGLESIETVDAPRGEWRLDPEAHIPVQSIYLFEVQDVEGTPTNVIVDELGTFDPVTGEPVE